MKRASEILDNVGEIDSENSSKPIIDFEKTIKNTNDISENSKRNLKKFMEGAWDIRKNVRKIENKRQNIESLLCRKDTTFNENKKMKFKDG